MTAANCVRSRTTNRKAVLYCSVCGNEAPIGESSVAEGSGRRDDDRVIVTCPHCGEVLVSQPTFDDEIGTCQSGGARAALELVDAVVRYDALE